jgi:hypothetical protein
MGPVRPRRPPPPRRHAPAPAADRACARRAAPTGSCPPARRRAPATACRARTFPATGRPPRLHRDQFDAAAIENHRTQGAHAAESSPERKLLRRDRDSAFCGVASGEATALSASPAAAEFGGCGPGHGRGGWRPARGPRPAPAQGAGAAAEPAEQRALEPRREGACRGRPERAPARARCPGFRRHPGRRPCKTCVALRAPSLTRTWTT